MDLVPSSGVTVCLLH